MVETVTTQKPTTLHDFADVLQNILDAIENNPEAAKGRQFSFTLRTHCGTFELLGEFWMLRIFDFADKNQESPIARVDLPWREGAYPLHANALVKLISYSLDFKGDYSG